MDLQEFKNELLKLNIELNLEKINQLEEYYNILIEENSKYNLTNITKKEDVYLKHFYDSLTLIKAIDLNQNLKVCDIGTGAGFPGIVLKIVFPNLNITLVDSLNKRIKFLNLVIEKLNLKNIRAIHSRIEDLKETEEYDLVVTRAVAKTNIILELGSQLNKINGYFILMKANIDDEIKEAENSINKLSFIKEDIIKFNLPIENSTRTLIKLKKIDHTNKKYPREFSKIKKNTL